jgi:hypothetical protein
LTALIIFFSRNARAQAHVEVGRSDDRLKAADQLAQRSTLGLKLLTSYAHGHVRSRLHARPVPQFKFVDFSPRTAAFFIGHNYTT